MRCLTFVLAVSLLCPLLSSDPARAADVRQNAPGPQLFIFSNDKVGGSLAQTTPTQPPRPTGPTGPNTPPTTGSGGPGGGTTIPGGGTTIPGGGTIGGGQPGGGQPGGGLPGGGSPGGGTIPTSAGQPPTPAYDGMKPYVAEPLLPNLGGDQQMTDQDRAELIVPDQICVIFANTESQGIGERFANDHESKVENYFRTEGLGLHVFLMKVDNPQDFDRVFKRMSEDGRPLWIQPNYVASTEQSSTASYGGSAAIPQYTLERMGISAEMTRDGGRDVLVAIVDSGVDRNHESLHKAEIALIDVVEETAKPVAEGHGTAIASIIAAQSKILGVAPSVRLLAVRAFKEVDPKTTAATSDSFLLSKGINEAVKAGAQVINLSLSGPRNRLVEHVVEQALFRGIVVVAAAGNHGAEAPPVYPAAQAGVIAVTATDEQDRLYAHANRGDYISVAAPGVDIMIARPGNAYGYLSGTSMASAQVAGVAALIIARSPQFKPSKLRQLLEKTATDLGAPSRDPEFGAGRVDVAKAMHQLAAN